MCVCVSDEEVDWVGAEIVQYDQAEENTAVDLLLHVPLTDLNWQSEPVHLHKRLFLVSILSSL